MPPTSADLTILIEATARGDRAAFRDLYGRTSAKLFAVATRIVRDRSMAEDVVQDAYVKAWQAASSYSADAGRPMTWLITITRNRAIDVIRQRREAAMPTDENGMPEDIASPGDGEADFARADQLNRCLDRLDSVHRTCLLAAYHEGWSREELSRRFERPVNTIKTWLHRSALSLKTCLDEP